jgi:signal transduction histidine kinase/ActR/RegA family two-component response regulator
MLNGIRRRLASQRLASKLAWLSAALTAVFVATTLIPLSVSTRETTRNIVADELARTQHALIVNQERDLAALQHAATLIGENARMRAAMADDQTQQLDPALIATTRRELGGALENVEKDIIVIVDQNGRVFADTSRDGVSLGRKTDLSSFAAVKTALDPEAPADISAYGVLDLPRHSYSVAAVPLVSAGRTLGAVLLGERIDTAYLAAVKSRFEGDVVLTRGNEKPPTGKDVVAAPLSLGKNRSGEPVTLWLLQPVGSGALTASIVAQFILYGLAAVILSGLGAALVARSLLRPLDRFVAYMKGTNPLAAAPLARPDLGDASPEIRTLDDSFASLMVSLRESEEQLRQSQKLEAIGTLAGGVAHDFNNLLTVMQGYAELALMRNDGRDARLNKDLTQVLEATQRASRLTHQLLAFSRKQVLEPSVLDVNEVVGELVPLLRRLIGEHITIDFAPGAELSHILADLGQLEQVIINLVINARDAMPSGGTISIRTFAVERGGSRVGLSVTDTGVGIPPEIRERIFEPFFTTKEPGKGTGLGLSMVYGIVQQSGGTIAVDSIVGAGTTFTIEFPASGAEKSRQRFAAIGEAIPRGTETVLLIEDEPELRDLARRTLDSLGYQVIAPEHTEDALAIAISRKVDLLLTDVVMPVMSGPTIVRRLADIGSHPPVVYMTGYADETLSDYRIDPGSMLLRKPFSPSQLARVVRSALDAVASHSQPRNSGRSMVREGGTV